MRQLDTPTDMLLSVIDFQYITFALVARPLTANRLKTLVPAWKKIKKIDLSFYFFSRLNRYFSILFSLCIFLNFFYELQSLRTLYIAANYTRFQRKTSENNLAENLNKPDLFNFPSTLGYNTFFTTSFKRKKQVCDKLIY